MKGIKAIAAATLAVGALLALGSADAAVFFAGKYENGKFVPDKDVKNPCFGIRYSTISTRIDGGRAVTRIEEHVTGPATGRVRTICLVALPKGVSPDSVKFTAKEGGLRTRFLTVDEARKVCEAIAKGVGSARVLSLAGTPALLVERFMLSLKDEVTVEFSQPVGESGGLFEYECPMPATGFAIGPVARLTFNAVVRSEKPLRGMFSPTHETTIERKGLYEARVRVAADDWSGAGTLRLLYVADEAPLGLRVLTHRAEGESEGYFMVLGNPTGSAGKEKAIEKDVLFVLDTSGSMRGEKMEQARSAIEYCLKELNPGDRFNVVTFGTEVKSFRDGLTAATAGNLKAAGDFIDEIVAVGRTNISGALARGLAGKPQKGRPRIMIFLTDGTPTAGELVPENIIKSLARMNESKTRIFVMGMGNDVNAHLLDRLAEDTDGSSEYVGPEEEIDVKVAALYNRLSHPVLTGVQVAFGELMTNSVYPRKVPALFRGSQFIITGRYRGGGTHAVTISGTLAGEEKKYTCAAEFPGKAAPANDYVAPLWAARKIGYLLQEIRLHGEKKELIEEVVRLSKKFGIVTEYTVFIATAGRDMSVGEIAAEATKRVGLARREKSGQWAVRQARNDADLQQRATAAPTANVYVDRRGRVVKADNIRQFGRRVLYFRNGRWEDAETAGDRKVRKVKLFSDEYFKLVRENADFRNAQAVGANLSINVGNERIEVEK